MEYILVATDALPNVTSSADAPLDHALMTLRSLPATLPIAVHTAKMIIYHQRHVAPGAYRPIVLRDHLRACCSVRNASVVFFLRAWLHGEERFRVEGRVTTLMNELCRGYTVIVFVCTAFASDASFAIIINSDSAPWYMHWFRLHAERHSQHNKDTLSEPLRRRFEDALSGRHAHNATLWTAYLHWEMAARSGSHEHGLARSEHTGHLKSTYFRALQACPWHKRLHLMAFDERNAVLRRAIDGREEREQLLDRMLESELRLRRVPEDEGE